VVGGRVTVREVRVSGRKVLETGRDTGRVPPERDVRRSWVSWR